MASETPPVERKGPLTWGGDTGNRTPDLLLAKQALYQLSYVPDGYYIEVKTSLNLVSGLGP